jgi:hypothetical protein
VTEFEGGNLKRTYDRLNRELTRSEERAREVQDRIAAIEDVSRSLFREWEKELKAYQNVQYREQSSAQLKATRAKYEKLMLAMRKVETSIHPVLNALRDQVLFLKHNLNAQAIQSLESQGEALQTDIRRLIAEMEASIAEAETFLANMESN